MDGPNDGAVREPTGVHCHFHLKLFFPWLPYIFQRCLALLVIDQVNFFDLKFKGSRISIYLSIFFHFPIFPMEKKSDVTNSRRPSQRKRSFGGEGNVDV